MDWRDFLDIFFRDIAKSMTLLALLTEEEDEKKKTKKMMRIRRCDICEILGSVGCFWKNFICRESES